MTLKEKIESLNLTRDQKGEIVKRLASEAGITTEAIYMILTGQIKRPPKKRLDAFSKVLDCEITK